MFQCEKGIKQGGEREREIEGKKIFLTPARFFTRSSGRIIASSQQTMKIEN